MERRTRIPDVVTNICKKKMDQAMPTLPGKSKRSKVPLTDAEQPERLLEDDCAAATSLGADSE